MKIVQVITLGHEIYGAQQHVLTLSSAFANDGHDVLVITGTTGALTKACDECGIEWKQISSLQRSIGPWTDWQACKDLTSILNEFQPDIVASHSSKAGFVSRWVCYRLGIRNAFTAHGWSFEDGVPFMRRQFYRWLEKAVGKISDKIIAVSNPGKELALKHKVVPKHNLVMIHYGTPDTGAKFPKNQQDVFTMTMVAGFRAQKDHETLVNALNNVKDRNWQINLLGDGELRSKIEKLVHQYGLQDKVHFRGMVDNVPDYLAQTDLLVLITNWEGLPISTLEGLTFSLPVLASDVSGVREQVLDGFNGLTVRRGNVDDVTQALVALFDNREKLAEYAANSRRLYEEHFTDKAMFHKTKALYQSMISGEE